MLTEEHKAAQASLNTFLSNMVDSIGLTDALLRQMSGEMAGCLVQIADDEVTVTPLTLDDLYR